MRITVYFEDTDGNKLGSWAIRDIPEVIQMHEPGNPIVVKNKRYEIVGRRAALRPGEDPYGTVRILFPYTPI